MVITSAINIDMQYKYVNTYVDAVQYDVNSRNVEITLLKAGSRADIPTGSTFEVKLKRPDGSSGSYSELSNGQAAVTKKETNVIVVWLSEFILSEAGETIVSVCIKNGETEVNTFSFIVNVQESPHIGTGLARMYPNTYDATATPSDIAIGKTAYVKGEKILGTSSQVGGGSGTIIPPHLGSPEYLIVNGHMSLPEEKKALARRNIDAVASVNGRTPDENGNVNLTTLIPPNVNAGGSGQHLVLVVDMRGGTPVWDQEYTFDQIYNAAEAGTLECYVGMNTDGNPSGDIDSWREATLDVIVSADASYGAKVVFNDTFRGYQYVWNSSGFTYYTIEAGGNGDLTGYATEEWVQDSFQPKGNYALKSEIPSVPTNLSAFTNDSGYLTEHQDISGKLDASALPTAINTALAQAKASGEFDGPKGDSVGIKSISENTESGGTSRIMFTDGHALAIKNGADGITPVRGESYWTPTDKQQIKQELIAAIITQEAGESETLVMSQKAVTDLVSEALGESEPTEYETVDSVDDMTDTSKQYILSTSGTLWTYGEVTVEKEPENVFVPANAILNQRIGTSSDSAKNGHYITEYLEFDGSTASSPIVWLPLNYDPTITDQRIRYCDAAKAKLGNIYGCNMTSPSEQVYIGRGENGRYYFDLSKDGSGNTTGLSKHYPSMKYLRMSLSSGKTTAITVSDIANVDIRFEKDRGTTIEYRWYDTGLAPSTVGGGGNWVDVIVKVNENKSNIAELNSRVIALESGSETLTIPAFWQDAVAACIAKIKALQVGKNCVTFPFFSDNHQRNGYAGLLIAHVMKECHIPYCFYGGDSISNGTIANEAEMIAQDKAFDTIMAYIPNGRLCRAVGNHDGYWYDGTNKYYYNRNQVYELFLREEAIAQNKHFGDDGTYYYAEDIASKVRFIVLNTNGGSVDDAQIAWFRDVALKVSDGWAVVVISHQPISNHYHANISNAATVRAVAVDSGVEIVGWFSGHIHRDRIYTGVATNTTDDSEGADMGFTQVVITSDHTSIAYDDATKHTVASDDQSHAIDFVTINRSTRTVNLTRLGIGGDRSYNY